MQRDEFLQTYCSHLNMQQREAVLTTEGPVLLLAVPGSGKTTVLVTRLGYMLYSCGIPAENILTLTYTVAATGDMERRFRSVFGEQITEMPEFRTINGICAKVIAQYGRMVGKTPFELITDEKKLAGMVAEIYMKRLNEYPTESDIRMVRGLITYAKNMMLNSEEIKALEKEAKLPLLDIYKEYNAMLKSRSLIDYDDQMIYAYMLLKKIPDLLQYYRNIYRYICVDEAQDTSKIQHAIISMLAGASGNLFMVGDEDQSIYGFRAAYPEALLHFEQDHPGAKVLLMETNYRSNAKIVLTADEFIQHNKQRHAKHMMPSKEAAEDITCIHVNTPGAQHAYLAKVAADSAERCAILYRDNESVIPLVDLLERQGATYRLKNADMTFFTHRVVSDLTNIMKFALEPDNSELFMQIYYKLKFYLKKTQAMQLCDLAKELEVPILEALERDTEITANTLRSCKGMRSNLHRLKDDTPAVALDRILGQMGYGEFLEKNDLGENKVRILKMLAMREKTVEDFLDRLSALQTVIRENERGSGQFILSTIHSSKGLEYDNVYLIDVCDGIFPDQVVKDYKKATEEEIRHYEEERRLFYVAMTRAKQRLYVFHQNGVKASFLKEIGMKQDDAPGASAGAKKSTGAKSTGQKPMPKSAYGKPKTAYGAQRTASFKAPRIREGDRVIQHRYGCGTIIAMNYTESGDLCSFAVLHDSGDTRNYAYPLAFQKGIRLLEQ